MPTDAFLERLGRLDPKPPSSLAREPVRTAPIEFMPIVQSRPRKGRRLGVMLTLALAATFGVKGVLLAVNGMESYDAWRQELAVGSPEKRVLALALYPDPVTVLIAVQMTPSPKEAEAELEAPVSPFAHLRHSSGITMIQAKQAPTEGDEATSD